MTLQDEIINGTQNEVFFKHQSSDRDFKGLSNIWDQTANQYRYAYNFTWMGRPIIQVPQDIYAIQELIWKVKPDLIIETGIAHGGSLIMSASMLALLDYCEGYSIKDPSGREVVGIDIEIRPHNRKAIEEHDLSPLIKMIEGSSIDWNVIKQVEEIVNYHKGYIEKVPMIDSKVMIFLDSNHTHDHVLAELRTYAPLVSVGSYIVVWDSRIEDLPEYMTKDSDKPWKKGNNPKTAIHTYLQEKDNFEIDKELENKLMITSTSDGFLRRIK